jgi:hypothetical protein
MRSNATYCNAQTEVRTQPLRAARPCATAMRRHTRAQANSRRARDLCAAHSRGVQLPRARRTPKPYQRDRWGGSGCPGSPGRSERGSGACAPRPRFLAFAPGSSAGRGGRLPRQPLPAAFASDAASCRHPRFRRFTIPWSHESLHTFAPHQTDCSRSAPAQRRASEPSPVSRRGRRDGHEKAGPHPQSSGERALARSGHADDDGPATDGHRPFHLVETHLAMFARDTPAPRDGRAAPAAPRGRTADGRVHPIRRWFTSRLQAARASRSRPLGW